MPRLVVASNRIPPLSEQGPRAGGLVVALSAALQPGSLWFGWSGRCSAPDRGVDLHRTAGCTYATIDLSEEEYKAFYVRMANGVLWPVLHCRLELVHFRRDDYAGYRAVNRRFAAALVRLLRPDDLVWVHDYHMFPLAEELRRLGVTNRIGFFLHTPFVPPTVLRALPFATELLQSMCAYDVVGFHTNVYRSAFLQCAAELLPNTSVIGGALRYRGRQLLTLVAPVGIDAAGFAAMAAQAAQAAETVRLRASLGDCPLAIGADRLDYVKGLLNRAEAFGHLLDRYPEHRRHVTFMQIAAPSREETGSYEQLRRALNQLVGDVNGRFSEADWQPLRYVTSTVRREVLAGFYRIARLGVVTPLCDGMNLVAKEYVAAQNPADPGVLLLSRFAGAAEELTEALLVNPFDIDDMADAMHKGLTMPLAERRRRHAALCGRVWNGTASHYCESFLGCLERPDSHAGSPSLRAAS